ncbi:MAG: ABC transporter permease [Verrucomicrobiota bacterium]|nr:ABC transporter permease [Verrucomicrobiota bacterium]
MASYIFQRIIYMILLLFVLSIASFAIIQLPPGDYLNTYIANLEARKIPVNEEIIEQMRERYGLGQPFFVQYFTWMGNLLQGDMGDSFMLNRPVNEVIGSRLGVTVILSLTTLLLVYSIAIPIGIYSATHQNSLGDYIATIFGFLGLATPNFLLALILMYLTFTYLGWSPGGLFSREYVAEDWSFGKFIDLLKHLLVPIVVIATAGTAEIIRILRGSLLDELGKQYVITARTKGVTERKLLIKYPVRIALNPIVSSIGYLLPAIISGATLTSIVMSIPTIGPILLQALQSQDMYLAGSIIMLLSALGLIGTLISDLLLVAVDPRIRFEARAT